MEKNKTANYIFIGLICIGVASGMYIGKPAVGAIVGVGLGFIVKAVVMNSKK